MRLVSREPRRVRSDYSNYIYVTCIYPTSSRAVSKPRTGLRLWSWCLQTSWRRPKGIDSRCRRKFKGTTPMPNIGYGSNKKTRHTLPNGETTVGGPL